MPIVCKIDVKKIDKSALFSGSRGTYLDIALIENRDGEDQYGNLGFVAQSLSRERREAGEKGPILGNWKRIGNDAAKPAAPRPAPTPAAGDGDITF